MKTFILIISLNFLSFAYPKEMADGIYFEMDESVCFFNKISQENYESPICLSESPVLKVDDFKKISDLIVDSENNLRGFTIILSEHGRKKLQAISKIYQGKNLAFVVNNRVFCLMKVNGVVSSGKIVITEETNHSSIKLVHRQINRILDL